MKKTIEIKLNPFFPLTRSFKKGSMWLEEGTDIQELIDRVDLNGDLKKKILAFVNGQKVDMNYRLKDGDELKLFIPLAGG